MWHLSQMLIYSKIVQQCYFHAWFAKCRSSNNPGEQKYSMVGGPFIWQPGNLRPFKICLNHFISGTLGCLSIQNVSDQEIQNTGSGWGQVLRYFWIFPRNQLFLHLPAQKYLPSFLIYFILFILWVCSLFIDIVIWKKIGSDTLWKKLVRISYRCCRY